MSCWRMCWARSPERGAIEPGSPHAAAPEVAENQSGPGPGHCRRAALGAGAGPGTHLRQTSHQCRHTGAIRGGAAHRPGQPELVAAVLSAPGRPAPVLYPPGRAVGLPGLAKTDWLGAALMLGAGLFYAAHLTVNQRVLYDVPAPTVALYTLTAMAVTVVAGYLVAGAPAFPPNAGAWQAVLLLTVVTLISRLSLFLGIKRLGGVQTALIGLSELLVTVLSAFLLLGEQLTPLQWAGAGLLAVSVLLVARERRLGTLPTPRPWTPLVARGGLKPTGPFAQPPAGESASRETVHLQPA